MSQTAEIIDSQATEQTLPARYYTDPDVFTAECRAIHFRSWHLVGHAGDLPRHGNYLTTRIVNQGVIVLRGADGTLRAFFTDISQLTFKSMAIVSTLHRHGNSIPFAALR